jgi:site-specific DNA-cytosine methylase
MRRPLCLDLFSGAGALDEPADHPFQGNQSAQYKQVGNAVAPPVAEALGRIVAELVRP